MNAILGNIALPRLIFFFVLYHPRWPLTTPHKKPFNGPQRRPRPPRGGPLCVTSKLPWRRTCQPCRLVSPRNGRNATNPSSITSRPAKLSPRPRPFFGQTSASPVLALTCYKHPAPTAPRNGPPPPFSETAVPLTPLTCSGRVSTFPPPGPARATASMHEFRSPPARPQLKSPEKGIKTGDGPRKKPPSRIRPPFPRDRTSTFPPLVKKNRSCSNPPKKPKARNPRNSFRPKRLFPFDRRETLPCCTTPRKTHALSPPPRPSPRCPWPKPSSPAHS